jgi:hypothetical protein
VVADITKAGGKAVAVQGNVATQDGTQGVIDAAVTSATPPGSAVYTATKGAVRFVVTDPIRRLRARHASAARPFANIG